MSLPVSLRLELEEAAVEDLAALPPKVRASLWQRLQELKQDPHGRGTRPLHGSLRGLRRLRAGDYRAAYYVEGDTVRVLAVGTRARFYDELERRDLG